MHHNRGSKYVESSKVLENRYKQTYKILQFKYKKNAIMSKILGASLYLIVILLMNYVRVSKAPGAFELKNFGHHVLLTNLFNTLPLLVFIGIGGYSVKEFVLKQYLSKDYLNDQWIKPFYVAEFFNGMLSMSVTLLFAFTISVFYF